MKKPQKIGKVRKGYLIDINPFHRGLVRHIIVDKYSVFIPTYGWVGKSFIEENYKIILFPGEIDYYDWWEGWWTTNWKLDCWGWCYGIRRRPDFVASRKQDNGDGTHSIFAA